MFPELGGWVVYAALGPELFFVISGFVILMTAWGRSVPDVVSSRVARLFPAYWTCVLLTGALLLWIWPGGKDVTGGQVAVNLTMVQSLFDVGNVDGVYWTLWAELRFYALIVLLTAIGITRRRVLLFTTLWPAAALVADAVGPGWLRTVLVAQYAPLFAAGMLLYVVHRDGHARVLWALIAANTAAAAWLVVPDQLEQQLRNTGESPSGVVLAVLVVGCVALVGAVTLTPAARVGWGWLTAAGALTYPLYLLHEHWGWWVIAHVYPAVPAWVAFALAAAILPRAGRRRAPRRRAPGRAAAAPGRAAGPRPGGGQGAGTPPTDPGGRSPFMRSTKNCGVASGSSRTVDPMSPGPVVGVRDRRGAADALRARRRPEREREAGEVDDARAVAHLQGADPGRREGHLPPRVQDDRRRRGGGRQRGDQLLLTLGPADVALAVRLAHAGERERRRAVDDAAPRGVPDEAGVGVVQGEGHLVDRRVQAQLDAAQRVDDAGDAAEADLDVVVDVHAGQAPRRSGPAAARRPRSTRR